MAVLALCVGGLSAVGMQVRCIDAAREAARLAARGEGRRVRSCTSVRTAVWWSRGSAPPRYYRGSRYPPRRQRPPNPASGERGSATLLSAAMIAMLIAFAAGGAYLGAAVTARHRAQAAADLAALGAAGAVVSGPDAACRQATQIAARMRSVIADCRVDGLDVVLEVATPVRLGRWGVGPARAVARAGPVDFVA
ncbi:Rv3654c family TadE-like protein [Mycolicibacterium neworleansense]